MINALQASLPSLIVTLIVLVLGAIAYRRNSTKQLGELQAQVIDTYKSQNEAQEKQIADLERKLARHERILTTIQVALKRRGLRIEIDGDSISIIDSQKTGTRTTTMKIIQVDKTEDVETEDKEEGV